MIIELASMFSRLPILAGDAPQQAAEEGQQTPPGMGGMLLVPLIGIMILFMWMSSRSQKKRQQQRQELLSQLKVKDDVVTIGGIVGRIVELREDEVVLRVDADKDIKMTVRRSAISGKKGEPEEQQ